MKISILSLALTAVSASYDPSELVPMRDYSKDFRTLSGWECFQAEGKFCHDKDHGSLASVTGSSNFGHAVCCKPDYVGEHCNSDSDHRCSQPVARQDTSKEFRNVLTGGMNHQMFAFLPKTNPKMCGISSSANLKEGSMRITANEGDKVQKISLTGDTSLKFVEGRPNVRAYDSCFYEVQSAVEQLTEEERVSSEVKPGEQRLITVNFSKMKEMNVYLYGGKDRYTATKRVTGGNQMVQTGKNYTVPVEVGMLIVAYPNENVQDTEFEFSYSVQIARPMSQGGNMMLIVIIVVIVVAAIIIGLVVRHYKNKNKVEVLSTPHHNVPQLQMVDKADETNEQHEHQTIENDGETHKVGEPLTDAEKGENPRYSQLPEEQETNSKNN